MMKIAKQTCLILLCALPLLASWSGHVTPIFYADNTEFFNKWRTGGTYLGNSLSSWVQYDTDENISFRTGIYLDAWYGDKPYIRDLAPILRLTWSEGKDKFQFIFGNLVSSNRHGLLDALYSEEYDYLRPNEYGFQIRQNWKHFTQDFWVNWNLLNTPAYREYFDFGTRFTIPIPLITSEIQTYISHHGGQLYHTGPVSDNLALAVGFDNQYPLPFSVLNQIGWKAHYITGKNVVNRAVPALTTAGNGFKVELYTVIAGFRIYGDYWKGHGFISEEGNSLYQCDDGYFFFGFRKEKKIGDTTLFHVELRGHALDGKLEYQYNFGFKSDFLLF